MDWIGRRPPGASPPRKGADFPRVFRHERTWPTDSGNKADMSAVATPAGAAPDVVPGWHSIPWRKVWRNVRRLQARIVKAHQEGRWGKVQALAYLLTHSLS